AARPPRRGGGRDAARRRSSHHPGGPSLSAPAQAPAPAPPAAQRVLAVDWLRGLAVLVMIQGHAMVLLLPELRKTKPFFTLVHIDALVAPPSILASGFSLGLVLVRAAAQGKLRDRINKPSRRVAEVWAVAFAYSIFFLNAFYRPENWLRVEILHC